MEKCSIKFLNTAVVLLLAGANGALAVFDFGFDLTLLRPVDLEGPDIVSNNINVSYNAQTRTLVATGDAFQLLDASNQTSAIRAASGDPLTAGPAASFGSFSLSVTLQPDANNVTGFSLSSGSFTIGGTISDDPIGPFPPNGQFDATSDVLLTGSIDFFDMGLSYDRFDDNQIDDDPPGTTTYSNTLDFGFTPTGGDLFEGTAPASVPTIAQYAATPAFTFPGFTAPGAIQMTVSSFVDSPGQWSQNWSDTDVVADTTLIESVIIPEPNASIPLAVLVLILAARCRCTRC